LVRSMPTPYCGDLLWSRVALNPSQVLQRSNLSATYVFLISNPFARNLHKFGVSHSLTQMITIKVRVREGVITHTRAQSQQHTHKCKEESATTR
jgi:hypothetical protein